MWVMTANRRILLNIVATYGRSLYALVVGLFCGRWVLLSLGEVDYGLLGVVGGMIGFVSFFNSLMSGSVSRFYAFSVGAAQKEGNERDGLEDCQKWFSIAVLIHTVLPVVLTVIGYPIGEWAVRNYLTVPPDRVEACVWVWRFTCLSCLVGMIGVPFSAMYNAKQEIAELTIYGFATTTLNAIFLYYMITHPGVWLVKYAAWSCALVVFPQLLICLRAVLMYQECRFRFYHLKNWSGFKQIFAYSGSRFIVLLSQMLSSSGMSILVNKCLGPAKNAAMTVGMSLSNHCQTLSASFSGAFSPAITNAAGAGDLDLMRKLAFRTCLLSTIAIGIFALPMILEVDEVLVLWLKHPPDGSGPLCVCLLVCAILGKLSEGHWMSIFAIGRIAKFNAVESIFWFLALPLAYLFFTRNLGIVGVGAAFVCVHTGAVGVKLYFGRKIAGLSVRHWLRRIFLPIILAFGLAFAAGVLVKTAFPPSFLRVVLTTVIVEVVLLPSCWLFVLQKEERRICSNKFFNLQRNPRYAA